MIKDNKNNSLADQKSFVKDNQSIVPPQNKEQLKKNENNKLIKNSINNDTFFEKFDKTKKDHKEKVKKLKRRKDVKSGTLTSLDKKLKSNKYLAKVYGFIGGTSAVIVTLGVILFVLLFDFFDGAPAFLPNKISIANNFYSFLKEIQFNVNIEVYKPLLQTTVIISMIAAGLVFTPIIYMLSSWFIGINNIHQEKKFIIAYWSIIGISAFLLFAALIFIFALGWGPFGPFNYPSQPNS